MFKGFKPRQDLSGFTAIPNEWFDEVMKSIDNLAELKIVQAVFRKTYGWVEGWEGTSPIYKLEDEISYSQFTQMTGLSSASIADGIKKAISHGYIIQVKAGDFKAGTTSKYRIRSTDDKAQTLVETSLKPNTPKVKKVIEKIKPKEVFEEEIYSTRDVKVGRKTQYDRYKEKEIDEYNANDVCYYFSDKYEKIIGVRYTGITNKDRSHAKSMLNDFGADQTVQTIDYLMSNYGDYISGYPSIAVLYGFRTSLVPSAIKGKAKNKLNVRETGLTEEEIKKAEKETEVVKW